MLNNKERFAVAECPARERGSDMKTAGIDELDKLWEEAKSVNSGQL
jgi:uncharacterized protein YabN with tetrapyrrole methylase and pyrophosphatase domain